jgi:hypothetical protein
MSQGAEQEQVESGCRYKLDCLATNRSQVRIVSVVQCRLLILSCDCGAAEAQ